MQDLTTNIPDRVYSPKMADENIEGIKKPSAQSLGVQDTNIFKY